MDGFYRIKKRAGLDQLTEYFSGVQEDYALYKEKDLYQQHIDMEYEQVLDRLSQIMQADCVDREDVNAALTDLSAKCQDVYFKAGMAAGFHVCKNLDRG